MCQLYICGSILQRQKINLLDNEFVSSRSICSRTSQRLEFITHSCTIDSMHQKTVKIGSSWPLTDRSCGPSLYTTYLFQHQLLQQTNTKKKSVRSVAVLPSCNEYILFLPSKFLMHHTVLSSGNSVLTFERSL